MEMLTTDEFKRFAKALKTYYPQNENLMPNQEAIELWFTELNDIPYKVLATALRKYVQTERFPPTIADMRRISYELTSNSIDWGKAWEIARRAISRWGEYNAEKGRQAIKEQDELAYETVERIGYMELCYSKNMQTDRANFRAIYEELKKEKYEKEVVNKQLQEVISKVKMIEQKENKND